MSDVKLVRPDATEALAALLDSRILVLDGAMGTMIQQHTFSEAEYRGERFADWDQDLKGNNDLLTLTQPDAISGIHRAYLEAGADLVETNTFNAQRISLADYGMAGPGLRAELRVGPAGPRRVRRDDRGRPEPAALRRRRARARPTAPRRSRRTSTTRAPATSPTSSWSTPISSRPTGWSTAAPTCCSIETIFDTLNAKAAIFALETLFEERGRRWPVMISGHDHRRLRPHAVRPGDRGVLELGPARPPAAGRPQLRARRGRRCGPTSPRSPGSPTASCPATRTPGCPTRSASTTRRRTRPPRSSSEFAESGLVNLARRLLRHHARPHRARWRRPSTGVAPRVPAERASGLPAVRARAADHHRRLAVRQRRRAHQHHRLGQVPQPDPRRRLQRRAVRGAPAGRERRAGHRRQHGRGDDRRRRRDGPLRQADRQRAGHQPRADHGRLVEVRGDRGRPALRPGQADRQLDLDEGGRGQVPRAGAAVPQVRRGDRGHGLRRGRPGRQPRAPQGDLRAGLPDPGRRGRLPGRGHHLRPEHLRGRHRHRGARQLRRRLHRGAPAGSSRTCRGALVSGGVSNVSFSFRGNNAVREAIHAVFLYHAIARRHGHGHRQRRRARRLRPGRRAAARADRGRRPQPAARRGRAAARDRHRVRRRRARRPRPPTTSGASCRSTSGSPTRWSRASTTTPRPTPRSCAR